MPSAALITGWRRRQGRRSIYPDPQISMYIGAIVHRCVFYMDRREFGDLVNVSASEVTTVWRYRNSIIIIIIN